MSDDKLPEIRESGMPGEIAGTGETPPEGPGKKKRRWIYYIVAAVVVDQLASRPGTGTASGRQR